jgi:anthranilate synthase/aminodeoxychorismate synthase-like glutamine amidotransferase
MKKVIIIDNHDSFSWNLEQLFRENLACEVTVKSIDDVEHTELNNFDKLVISPGPDIPSSYPKIFEILRQYSESKSILGVCLGHQAIVEFFGGKLVNLDNVYHGICENIRIDNKAIIFNGLNANIKVGLYHSWAADSSSLPDCLEVIAESKIGIIMGVKHKVLDVTGIQFHPESYMTEFGEVMIENWIKSS